MEKVIFLNEVLKIMEQTNSDGKPIPFDLVVREFSWQNKTGGKIKYYNNCVLSRLDKKSKKKPKRKIQFDKRDFVRKNPNDSQNFTRQILLPDGRIKSISILFIIKFNNIQMVY